MKNNAKHYLTKYGPVSLATAASLASAQSTATSGIDFTAIATAGVGVIAAAGAAGAALILSGNGLKIAVKWAKRMVGMA